ncbi:MAG TPA: hypothetical protein VFJ14_11320 [Nocardioidaceae bacterium]|nr:hypothetical protein [Nocardioidaceae bacterium]
MSDDLQARVQSAIEEYLAENGGGFVTSWHFIADFIDSDGEQSWLHHTAEDQTMSTTMGLIRWAQGVADYEQQRYLDTISE